MQDAGETLSVNYDETDPTAAATQIQTWLNSFTPVSGVSDGSHATVTAIDPHTFVVDFGTATEGLDQSTLLQYLPVNNTLSGYLPAVSVSNLDRPFTINNIPVSATNPDLTAEAIASYFQPPSVSGATAVAPFAFPAPTQASNILNDLAPYTEPVASNAPVSTTPTTFTTVQPVAGAGGALSSTQFDVTFTGISGTTVDAQMVVTSCVSASGAVLAQRP